jgi:4-aminobutyrate aminotransferase-like enzyme
VRGWGLALAVDVVDPVTRMPDHGRAMSVVDGMRQRGVLIGRTGPERASLKIRPPLVFTDDDAEVLVTALTETLRG